MAVWAATETGTMAGTGGSKPMKVERFIKEYANYKKKSIDSNELMKEEYKQKALTRIDNTLKAKERGMITVDEAMLSMINALND